MSPTLPVAARNRIDPWEAVYDRLMPDPAHQTTPGLISRKGVFKGRVVDLSIDHVLLPNGNETDFEMIRHPGAAVALPIDTDENGVDHVVLLRQYRHAAGGWLLEVPGGKLDEGEEPEVCARRELEEEIGLTAGQLTALGAILTTPGFTDEKIWIYIAHDLTPVEGGRSSEADEVMEMERIPFSDAVAMAASGDIADAKTVAALLRAAFYFGADLPAD
jgi:ADP-ribose pyrophosphatase